MAWLPHQQQQQQQYMLYVPHNGYPAYSYPYPPQQAPQHATGGQQYWSQPTPSHGAENTQLGRVLQMASERVGSAQNGFREDLRRGLSVARRSTNREVQEMGGKMREYTWHLEASVIQGTLNVLARTKGMLLIVEDGGSPSTGALRQRLLAPDSQQALQVAKTAMETANENAKESEHRLRALLEEAGITQDTFTAALKSKMEEIKVTSRRSGYCHGTERFFEGAGAMTAAAGGVAGGFAGAGMVAFGISTAALLDIAGGCGAATVLFTLIALYAYCKRVKAKGKVRRKKLEKEEIQKATEEIASIVAALYGIETMLLCVVSELGVILKELEQYAAGAANVDLDRMNVLVRQAGLLHARCTDFEGAVQHASYLVVSTLERTA